MYQENIKNYSPLSMIDLIIFIYLSFTKLIYLIYVFIYLDNENYGNNTNNN